MENETNQLEDEGSEEKTEEKSEEKTDEKSDTGEVPAAFTYGGPVDTDTLTLPQSSTTTTTATTTVELSALSPRGAVETDTIDLQLRSEETSEASGEIPPPPEIPKRTVVTRASISRAVRASFLATGGIPPVACVRAPNSYFIELNAENKWTATGKLKHLSNAFGFIQTSANFYRLLHLDSGKYLCVKPFEESGRVFQALHAMSDEELSRAPPSTYTFRVVLLLMSAREKEIHVRILWGDSSGLSMALDPVSDGKLLIFGNDQSLANMESDAKKKAKEMEEASLKAPTQLPASVSREGTVEPIASLPSWTMELVAPSSVTREIAGDALNIVWTLDLVSKKRPEKRGALDVQQCDHIQGEDLDSIMNVFRRMDTDKCGYAPFKDLWTDVLKYCRALPRLVIKRISDATLNVEPDKFVHVADFLATIDLVWDTFHEEILMEMNEDRERREKEESESIETKLRRLDTSILVKHPFFEEWQSMSRFQRWLYDHKKKASVKLHSRDSGMGLWRKHLVSIQGNFGESIYVYFEFIRWLFILNLLMALLFLYVIVPKAGKFNWLHTSPSAYIDILFGNEFTDSWYFYGAFDNSYGTAMFGNIGFVWVLVCGLCIVVCIVAVLTRVLGSSLDSDASEDDVFFSRNVFSSFNFAVFNRDAITLQRNSIMIRLHEMLLAKLDATWIKVTCTVILRRVLGALLTLILALASAGAIVYLITFEDSVMHKAEGSGVMAMARVSVYIVPAGVAAIKVLMPRLIRRVVAFEKHSADVTFQQEFLRVFALRMFAILVTLFQTAQEVNRSTELEEDTGDENKTSDACAESQIGMILFRFVLFDLFLEVLFNLVLPSFQYWFFRCFGCIRREQRSDVLVNELNERALKQKGSRDDDKKASVEYEIADERWKTQFDIPTALLDAMYRQTIVWSGMYFSPMICWLAVFATYVSFFGRKRYLFQFCGRPKKALGVVKQLRFFYGMMLFAIVVALLPFQFFLNRTPDCGPHSGDKIMSSFRQDFAETEPKWMEVTLQFALNGLVLVPLLLLSTVYIFYLRRTRSTARCRASGLYHRLQNEVTEKKQILSDYKIRL